MLFFGTLFLSPLAAEETAVTVLKRIAVKIPLKKGEKPGFGLLPGDGGVYLQYKRYSDPGKKDVRRYDYYLQVNDYLYGPHEEEIQDVVFGERGDHGFVYTAWVQPQAGCYDLYWKVCVAPLFCLAHMPLCRSRKAGCQPVKSCGAFFFDGETGFLRNNGRRRMALVNGKRYGPYDDVSVILDRRPGHFYLLYKRKGEKGVVWNGKDYGPDFALRRKALEKKSPGFGRRVDYGGRIVKESKGYSVREGNTQYGPYERVPYAGGNNDGTSWGFAYVMRDRWHIWINGKTFGPYDGEVYPRFSRRGRLAWFYFIRKGRRYLYINGKIHDGKTMVYHSEDGRSVVLARRGKEGWVFQTGGKSLGPYPLGHIINDSFAFSHDGSRFGFCYRKGDWRRGEEDSCIWCGGVTLGPFSQAGFHFTADGRAVAGYLKEREAFLVQIR